MTQRGIIFAAGVFSGLILSSSAQETTLPANPSNKLEPLVPVPENVNLPLQGTLQTTTVQSTRPVYHPNQKVTADRYYSMLGTTGSVTVNAERAKADQEAALQRARRQKQIKDRISSTVYFGVQPERRFGLEYLKVNPPAEEGSVSASSVQNLPPTQPPPEDSIDDVKVRGSDGSLAARIRMLKERNAPEEAAPEVTADRAPRPAYSDPDPGTPVPAFATLDGFEDSSAAAAVDSPPPQKKSGFFSKFGKKQRTGSQVGSQVGSPAPVNHSAPSIGVAAPAPPQPAFKSIFRSSVSARKANSYSVVQGDDVFAMVNGEALKLSAGTRVKVLRRGTDRSVVRLYDNRQATVANGALVSESE